jgi:hypothetical protein
MGILDDAIREHLELKRKHGVPEEEVERQEEEALGPARREVAQQPEDADIAADEAAPTVATGGAPPSPDDDTALFDGEPPGPAAVHPEEAFATEPEPDEPLADAPLADAPPFEEPEPAEPSVADHTGLEPPPADDAPVLGDTEPHGFPAVEDDAEPDEADEPGEDEGEGEDGEPDVLEDTPDFLQETPEHDRLWFEQKPPRDFDFD